MQRMLGPFDLGQAPLITVVLTPVGNSEEVSTACVWTVKYPEPNIEDTTYTQASPEVSSVEDNVWTLQLPPTEYDGVYWIRCQSTEGLLAAGEIRLGVRESVFD